MSNWRMATCGVGRDAGSARAAIASTAYSSPRWKTAGKIEKTQEAHASGSRIDPPRFDGCAVDRKREHDRRIVRGAEMTTAYEEVYGPRPAPHQGFDRTVIDAGLARLGNAAGFRGQTPAFTRKPARLAESRYQSAASGRVPLNTGRPSTAHLKCVTSRRLWGSMSARSVR